MMQEVNDNEYERMTVFSGGKTQTNKFQQSPKNFRTETCDWNDEKRVFSSQLLILYLGDTSLVFHCK
jgi:hypothetical protein